MPLRYPCKFPLMDQQMDRQLPSLVAVGRVGGGLRENREDTGQIAVLGSPTHRFDSVSAIPLPVILVKTLNLQSLQL